ncbi:MAG TPA: glycosyltransferase family 1 protein [Candidatus Saccharimonadia bacterium]|nr:glycosyltransferase family 1 protein [Candidatus Saccharimonadia bacterium]
MKIVIDARMLFWTGIGRYTHALLDELQQADHDNSYTVLIRRADWGLWEPNVPNFTKVESSINPYSFGEQWALWLQLRALRADVVHFTAPNAPLLYRGRRVVTVHDLTLLDFDTSRGRGVGKWLRGLKRIPFRLVLAGDVRLAAGLITVTDYVRDQLVGRFGARAERLHTTLLAADPQLAQPEPLERFGKLGKFVLYVGNAYPYKNIGTMIEALAALRESHADLGLVIAGKRDEFTSELERRAAELGVGERVRFVGFVSDGELVALYRAAAAYVNPSLSEGFGLQGLEAMTQGLPVVAARATCLPEVYGEAAEYFDPREPADQAAALARVLDDAALAERLRTAGRARVRQFSWRRMAEQTLAVYQAASGRNSAY